MGAKSDKIIIPIAGRIEAGWRLAHHYRADGLLKMPQGEFLAAMNYQKWFDSEPRLVTLKFIQNVQLQHSNKKCPR